jgi:hypothetical protein
MVGVGFGIVSAKARQGEFAEQIRRIGMQRDQTVGLATAKSAASGVELSSVSTVDYLKRLTYEFDREISNVRKTADATKTADMLSLFAGGVGGGAQIYGKLGAANNWFQYGNQGGGFSNGNTNFAGGVDASWYD